MKKRVETVIRTYSKRYINPFRYGIVLLLSGTLLFSCSSGENENNATDAREETGIANESTDAPVEDEGKGIGPITTVEVSDSIDEALATEGKTIFEGKCAACHTLTNEKVVGPGLLGVTERRKSEWIMNMVINPEEMTKKDPAAKKLLAEHLTQMTNQDITEKDARALLEFMRLNDLEANGK